MQKVLEVAVILSAVDRMTRVVSTATNNVINKLASIEKASSKVSKKAYDMGRDFGAIGLAAGAALTVPLKAAMDFEDGMSNIRKVVDGLNDSTALAAMAGDIRNLSREIPLPIDQLQELVAAGGRMGIPRDQLIAYTREVSKMAMAFDAPAAEIGEQMGKLATVFNIPIPQIGKLADTINYLDDNAIAKGTDIIDVMRRVGGTAQQVGLAAPNVAALASTFLTLGSSAEVAGTASNALIRELSIATLQPDRFQTGLQAIGLTAKEVQKNMAIDAQGTIMKVLEAIEKLPKEQRIGVTTQLFGKEYGDDIAKITSGLGEYRRQLALINDPRLNGSMQREFAIRAQNASAQAQLLKNNVRELSIMFGSALLPMLNRLMAAVRPYVVQLVQWVEKNQTLAATIGGIVAGIAAFSLAASGVSFIVGGVAKGVELLSSTFGLLVKGLRFVGTALAWMGRMAMTNPIILIIGLIAMAVWLIIENWDTLKGWFTTLWNTTKVIFSMAWEWIKNLIMNYTPYGLIFKHWDTIKGWFIQLWDATKIIFSKAWEWIKSFFMNYTPQGLVMKHWGDFTDIFDRFYAAGQNIINMLWEGIKSLAHKPVDAIKEVVGKMRDYLPFSPAKVGPFRDLHRVKIVETIAQAVKPAPLLRAFNNVAGMAFDAIGGGGQSMSFAGAGGGSVNINFSPTINLSGAATESDRENILALLKQYQPELVRMVEDGLARRKRTQF